MEDVSTNRSLRERWEDYRPSKTQTFWIAAGGIVATLVIGFGPAGWVTGGKAEQMVSEAAAKSRQELAAAVCVEDFMRSADAGSQLNKIKNAQWYERDKLVTAAGWATMPDRKEPSSAVAGMCASRIADLDPSVVAGASQTTTK